MKYFLRALALAAVYAAVVIVFETLLGFLQPANEGTLTITTTAADGTESDRVLARLEDNGELYVAANHWPRAWYRAALARPVVAVTMDGERQDYLAVPVTGSDHERLAAGHAHSLAFKVLTGFPPRRFLHLEPR